jgi:NAD-dependent dihydropyrimidine dehydrogenase PreA subunit
MAYVVTSPCIGTKDGACTKVCPVSCFYDAGEMLRINPEECIICGACVSECPVAAIFPEEDVPPDQFTYIESAKAFFEGKSTEELEKLRVI